MTYQLTAPLLDACVLGVVENEDVYGYTLTQRVMDVVDISESTLYPVLRRLQKSGLLTTYDQPYQGRNRRYYSITAEGSAQLLFFRNEWDSYKTKIDQLINPNSDKKKGLLGTLSEETVSGTADGNEISLTLYHSEHEAQNNTISGLPDGMSESTDLSEGTAGNAEGGIQ
ncbi:MAG: PadR family transcriptional regulator [Lachnospiraceae bacterium]|nr:PadR family transcriptional regulator [Lachnospiraceae bacterium]